MRIILLLAALVWLSLPAPRAFAQNKAASAERVAIHAILIVASDKPGETDQRLTPYEPTLRRILRFASYRFIGEGRASLGSPGKGGLDLGRGHRLEIETDSSDRNAIRVRIRWLDGEREFMKTGLQLRPGVPAVLGGPPWGDKGEVCAVIVTAD